MKYYLLLLCYGFVTGFEMKVARFRTAGLWLCYWIVVRLFADCFCLWMLVWNWQLVIDWDGGCLFVDCESSLCYVIRALIRDCDVGFVLVRKKWKKSVVSFVGFLFLFEVLSLRIEDFVGLWKIVAALAVKRRKKESALFHMPPLLCDCRCRLYSRSALGRKCDRLWMSWSGLFWIF